MKWPVAVLAGVVGAIPMLIWSGTSFGPTQEVIGTVTAKRYSPAVALPLIDGTLHVEAAEYVTEVTSPLGEYRSYSAELYDLVQAGDPVAVRWRQRFWKGKESGIVIDEAVALPLPRSLINSTPNSWSAQ